MMAGDNEENSIYIISTFVKGTKVYVLFVPIVAFIHIEQNVWSTTINSEKQGYHSYNNHVLTVVLIIDFTHILGCAMLSLLNKAFAGSM